MKYQFKGEKLFDNIFEVTAKTISGESLSIKRNVVVYEENKPKIGLAFTSHEDGYHYAHDNITGTLTVTDESGIREVHVYYDGNELPVDEENHVYINDFVVKNHTVVVRAVDNFGNVAVSGMVFYTVTGSSGSASGSSSEELDSKDINAFIYSPADGGTVKGLDYIIGRADGTNFSKYKLEYASVSDNKYVLIKEDTKPKNNAIIGEFDTTMLRNGMYNIRLTVWDKNGNSFTDEKTVSVEGRAKIGNFSIAFQDMDLNVAGIPVTLIREYDSRDRNVSGDFGYGWNISTCSATITKSCDLSSYWEMTRSRFDYNYSEIRPHIVSINWGNGEVEKFRMKVTSGGLSSIKPVSISYEPMIKNGSSLVSSDFGSDMLYSGGQICTGGGDEYDPKYWILTKADGTEYTFNQDRGLTKYKDTKGNVLEFYINAIVGNEKKQMQ